MEENNYRDEFELFLKESADEFKMVPSRRIWFSLYNNLHPDRKWPSMAVCLFILTAVLYIGIANNNSLSNAAKKASKDNFTYSINEKNKKDKFTFSRKNYLKQKNKQQPTFSLESFSKNDLESIDIISENVGSGTVSSSITNEISFENNITEVTNVAALNDFDNQKSFGKNNKNDKNIELESDFELQRTTKQNLLTKIEVDIPLTAATENLPVKLNSTQIFIEKNNFSFNERSWLEDYSFRNKPAINKFKQNTTLSYYITPSLGYRILSKIKENNRSYSSFAAGRTNNEPMQLLNNAALNFEVGFVLQYKVSKKFRIKSGVQANYTNYISNVTALGHPLETSINLNNNNNNIRSSNYSSKVGNDKINKTTVQIALPLGADFKIAGNQKVGWYAGGNIQPTYILGGSAYVLSADEKYYISENAMLRKFNLNTSIETFISFKSSKGVVLNVGPQFRYQLLSTYKKSYGYTENLYNVGVKVGVTTSF